MAEPITLSNEEAGTVLQVIFNQLQRHRATDVLHAIDESRRFGIEEDVSKQLADRGGEQRKVGTIRRRPATDIDMLRIVFEELRQRLIVFPAIIDALEQRLGTNQIVWRVDREFVSPDQAGTLEARIHDFRPPGSDQLQPNYEKVRELIPAIVPAARTEIS